MIVCVFSLEVNMNSLRDLNKKLEKAKLHDVHCLQVN